MKEVLLPVDGSERSLHSLEAVKRIYPPDQAALTILMVAPGVESAGKEERILGLLEQYALEMEGYEVKTVFLRGVVGPVIVDYAREKEMDAIVMTRSSRGPLMRLGSVSAHVVKHADFLHLFVLRESGSH